MGFALTDSDFYFALFQTDGTFQESVPEPASIVLFAVGLCGILVIRQRLNSKAA